MTARSTTKPTLAPDTMIRVCRQRRMDNGTDYGTAELFAIVPFKHLRDVLGYRHHDTTLRVGQELTADAALSTIYMNDGSSWGTSNTLYVCQVINDLTWH